MSPWRNIRNNASYLVILFLILYVAYFASEICTRIQNIQKYERLKNYEAEIDDLTSRLVGFHRDSHNVKNSLGILKEALSDIIKIYNNSNMQNASSMGYKIFKSNVRPINKVRPSIERRNNAGFHVNDRGVR